MTDSTGTPIVLGDILIEPNNRNVMSSRLHVFAGEYTATFLKTVIIHHHPDNEFDGLGNVKVKPCFLSVITEEQARNYIAYYLGLNNHGEKMSLLIEANINRLIELSQSLKNNQSTEEYSPYF